MIEHLVDSERMGCYYLTRIIINDVNELEEAGAYDKVS